MKVKIIKNNKLWMEDEAIRQLEKISQFAGVEEVAGLPDLHQGKTPVGTTIKTKNIIYPYLIGNDIGCGMSLFDTHIRSKNFDMNKFVKRLENTRIFGDCSIGGGNHFAELQMIDKIYSDELSLDKKHLFLLVHSGSRNLGDEIYRKYASLEGLRENTKEFEDYLRLHQKAVEYAKENRIKVADSFMDKINIKYDNQLITDCIHNYLGYYDGYYYHHKGTISAWTPYAVIAGSRGTYSYIVKCIPKEETLYSISHGAGRKWARYLCKGRLETKYKKDELKTTQLGGKVVTNKKELLYEEASEAYKNIDDVINVLLEYGCIELIARLKPLVTYKC